MSTQSSTRRDLTRVKAILFDLHHTITKTRVGMLPLTREAGEIAGIDFDGIANGTLRNAIQHTEEWMKEYQIENDVDIHWGGEPNHWIEANRKLFDELEIPNITDEMLLSFERAWKHLQATNWESLLEGAKQILETLRDRGYILGICTRRHDDPKRLLEEWGIHDLFATIHYSGVPGYAKPSPFTLLKAAEEIGVNPRLCAYVGNYVDADLVAAKQAEMIPILTVWANPGEKTLVDDETLVLEKFDEILHLFPRRSM